MATTNDSGLLRRATRWLLWLVGGTLLMVVLLGIAVFASTPEQARGRLEGSNELSIPPLAESRLEGGVRVFDLEATASQTTFPGIGTSETWGFNGSYLGPTLRAARGERVRVEVTNRLDEATTVHWHGMHLPAAMDGGPHQVIASGATWSPTWQIDQPAATLWYHPHEHVKTAEHVYRGLAGLFLIDDDEDPDLPDDYGVDDIPLVIQDREFDNTGQMVMTRSMLDPIGFLGSTILMNGTYDPFWQPTTEMVRFRILNASNSRTYNLGFSDGRQFQLIATDSGLVEHTVTVDRIQVSPGERIQILGRFTVNEEVTLDSVEPDLGTNPLYERLSGGHDSFDILTIRTGSDLSSARRVPERLTTHEKVPEPEATRRFELDDFRLINGQPMDMSRVDEIVIAGTTEVWEIVNTSMTPHNFHIHDVRFKVLDINGQPPPATIDGWKDTVGVPPRTTVRIVTTFSHYTDPHLPYMFHCHLLAHEDAGMMGQFVVVSEDQIDQVRVHDPKEH